MEFVLNCIDSWWHQHFICTSQLNLALMRCVYIKARAWEAWGPKHPFMDLALSSRLDQAWSLVSQIGCSIFLSQNRQDVVGKWCHINAFFSFSILLKRARHSIFFHTLDTCMPKCKLLGSNPRGFLLHITFTISLTESLWESTIFYCTTSKEETKLPFGIFPIILYY